MTSKEALKSICLECEIWKGKNKVRCPFRSISSDYCEEYETIKKDLDRLEKMEKAIDIIKTKKIDIHLFIYLLSKNYPCKNYSGFLFNSIRDEYNHITLKHFGTSLDNLLTEEEGEILKEVLENEQS